MSPILKTLNHVKPLTWSESDSVTYKKRLPRPLVDYKIAPPGPKTAAWVKRWIKLKSLNISQEKKHLKPPRYESKESHHHTGIADICQKQNVCQQIAWNLGENMQR